MYGWKYRLCRLHTRYMRIEMRTATLSHTHMREKEKINFKLSPASGGKQCVIVKHNNTHAIKKISFSQTTIYRFMCANCVQNKDSLIAIEKKINVVRMSQERKKGDSILEENFKRRKLKCVQCKNVCTQ